MRTHNLLTTVSVAALLSACANNAPKVRTAQTAYEQYQALKGPGQRAIAGNFYQLGRSDAVMSEYWVRQAGIPYRRSETSQETPKKGDGLKRGYAKVLVPAGPDADGTIREAHYETIEVVK